MVRFSILDCPVFPSWGIPVLLAANPPVTVVSCVIASVAKNPQRVLTILGGSTLVAESMDYTTLPKVDKVDASSAEAPTA
jgi:hypothetical protein